MNEQDNRNYQHNAMSIDTELIHLNIVLNELLISKRQANDIINMYKQRIDELNAIISHNPQDETLLSHV